nr:MAG TPA: hypothetical protein [Caudoviricetes sp.]
MECSIYDSTLHRIGLFSTFTSLVWGESYTGVGKLQLVVPKTDNALPLIAVGNFVGIPTSDTLMLIQSTEDKDGELWAYGCEAKCLLDARVYVGSIRCSGKIETALRNAVSVSRPYSILGLADARGLTATTVSQRTYPSLYELSRAWCEAGGYGFRLVHNKTSHKLLYDVYEGVTKNGIKFAEQYGNLSNLKRLISETTYKNVAYVGGGGEGSDRVFVTTGETTSADFTRREVYVDARDLQREDDQTLADYQALLKARGNEKLAELARVQEITFDISAKDFGTSFNLGDKITCILPEYNSVLTVRIAEFARTYEKNLLTTQLTLGNPIVRSI